MDSKQKYPKVYLLNCTPEPEKVIALAAKLCYSDSDIPELRDGISGKDQSKFLSKILGMGHFSVLEHASFTFGIEGISRSLSHQLVRHRVASYSQKSQRYVTEQGDFNFIVPDSIKESDINNEKFQNLMDQISSLYRDFIDSGVNAEDARYILPNACETKIVVTMNARELLHFFSLRCCERAQWEIHAMADEMLRICFEKAPVIFSNAGPGCLKGICPEGEFSCGKISEVRQKYAELLGRFDRFN